MRFFPPYRLHMSRLQPNCQNNYWHSTISANPECIKKFCFKFTSFHLPPPPHPPCLCGSTLFRSDGTLVRLPCCCHGILWCMHLSFIMYHHIFGYQHVHDKIFTTLLKWPLPLKSIKDKLCKLSILLDNGLRQTLMMRFCLEVLFSFTEHSLV